MARAMVPGPGHWYAIYFELLIRDAPLQDLHSTSQWMPWMKSTIPGTQFKVGLMVEKKEIYFKYKGQRARWVSKRQNGTRSRHLQVGNGNGRWVGLSDGGETRQNKSKLGLNVTGGQWLMGVEAEAWSSREGTDARSWGAELHWHLCRMFYRENGSWSLSLVLSGALVRLTEWVEIGDLDDRWLRSGTLQYYVRRRHERGVGIAASCIVDPNPPLLSVWGWDTALTVDSPRPWEESGDFRCETSKPLQSESRNPFLSFFRISLGGCQLAPEQTWRPRVVSCKVKVCPQNSQSKIQARPFENRKK